MKRPIGSICLATERCFARVGGNREIQVNLRVIAATNRDLEQAVHNDQFRKDLYYRLNIFPIHILPLREHPEDAAELAEHLLDRLRLQYHITCHGITDEAMQCLGRYSWPGNIRELRNVLERGMLMAKGGVIGMEHLPCELTTEFGHDDAPCDCMHGLNRQVEQFRKDLIVKALGHCAWRKKDAARILGLSPRALSHYISKYDIDRLKQ